jgi:hypothetical protein
MNRSRRAVILAVALAFAALCVAEAGTIIDLTDFPNPARLTIDGGASQDYAGSAIAAADLNGDGAADIIIGAPSADPGGRLSAGTVYVVYGGPNISGNVFLTTTTFTGPRLSGKASLDQFGESLAVGDFNGDGVADLAVGASFSLSSKGTVYLFFGRVGSFSSVDLASQQAPLTVTGAQAEDRAGGAIALGDLDGDGLDELIIGARRASPSGRASAGQVHIIRGSRTFSGTVDLATSPGIVIKGPTAGEEFGSSLATGDVDGDGKDDLLIGAQFASPSGRSKAGAAYLVKGRSPLVNIDLASQPADLKIIGAAANDYLGNAVALGDLDGNNRADLVLGANGRLTSRGAAYGLLWGSSGLTGTVDLASQTPWAVLEGANSFDDLGGAVGTGDLDLDGAADLLAGASRADPSPSRQNFGILYGLAGVRTTVQHSPLAVATPDLEVWGANPGDRTAAAFAVADITKDAKPDLIIAAPRADSFLGVQAGRIYLLAGPCVLRPPPPPTRTPTRTRTPTPTVTPTKTPTPTPRFFYVPLLMKKAATAHR